MKNPAVSLAVALATAMMLTALQPAGASVPMNILAKAAEQDTPSLAPMLEQVTPAVVNISTRGRVRRQDNPLLQDPFFRFFFDAPRRPTERQTQSLGSGVIVDGKRGLILTNNHVVEKADEITVTLRDRRHIKAKLVGTDPETDVAVIQIPGDNLTEVPLADSDALRVGDFVVAIGNPFGLGQTVTSGIVSALGRSGLGIEGYEDFIQTDASINPGNSGGALINLKGELVGINTAILSPGGGGNVGIGFAIPVNMARAIMQQLVEHGEVRRGRLGVYIQDLTPELAGAFSANIHEGAVISQVTPDSPADKAGLKPGDVIVEVDGRAVGDAGDLRNIIGLLNVGQTVDLKVLRNGRVRTLSAVVTEPELTKVKGGRVADPLAGAVLGLLDSPEVQGIQVLDVDAGSPAWRAGLRPEDIIVSVNRLPVRDFDELRAAVQRSRRGLLLNIQRGNRALFVLVQ